MATANTANEPAGKVGDPSQKSGAATTMFNRTRLLRAIYGGTEPMRELKDELLPQYEKESQTRYDARLASTFSLNKLREAVDAASAKPFKSLVKLRNADPDLDILTKDVDLRGNHLHIFAHRVFNDALLVGQSHILVDHPTTTSMPNLAVQKAAGVRPFFKHIKDDQVPAVYSEYVGGDIQVTHVRISSSRVRRTADFKEEVINIIYVLEKEVGANAGIVQTWEQPAASQGGEWTFIGETPLTMPEVPFVTMFAGEQESDFVTRPIFYDLAFKQVEHWISSSDQRSILAAGRFPMLAASGVELDPEDESGFAIGPYKVLYSPEAGGRWYYVEPEGKAIAAGAKDLEMIELHMDMMALNPVQATHRQYVPQNERDIQETRVHSVIHDLAMSCRDTLKTAIMFAGTWNNRDYSAVEVDLDSDFTNTADKQAQIGTLLQAYEKRGISRQTFLTEAKKLGMVADDFDIEAELVVLQQADEAAANAAAKSGSGAKTPAADATKAPKVDFPSGQDRPTRQI